MLGGAPQWMREMVAPPAFSAESIKAARRVLNRALRREVTLADSAKRAAGNDGRVVAAARAYFALHFDTVYRQLRDVVEYAREWRDKEAQLSEGDREVLASFGDALGRMERAGDAALNDMLARAEAPAAQAAIKQVMDRMAALYGGGLGLADLLTSGQMLALYGIKLVRVVLLVIALGVTTRVFQPLYDRTVYAEQSPSPPNLLLMLLVFLGVDMALNVALFLVLSIQAWLAGPGGAIVDLGVAGVDYALATVCLGVLGAVVGQVLQSKKYFKYRVDGRASIAAFRDVLLGAGAVLTAVPFGLASSA